MFPFRDHNPSDTTPFVTWALIALNVLIFLSYYPQYSGDMRLLGSFFDTWALVPAEVLRGGDPHTLLSSMFLHGNWLHLIFNMLFLYVFGDNVEDLLGHLGFLVFYVATGLAAAAAQIFADPNSGVPVVGASGAIAGVMGGYLLMFPRARIDILVILVIFIRVFTLPAWIMLGLWFALQVVNGAVAGTQPGGGVAYWAHAGGFVAGVALLIPAWLSRGGPSWWSATHGLPPHGEAGNARDPFADGPVRSTRVPRAGRTRSAPRGSSRRGPWSGDG